MVASRRSRSRRYITEAHATLLTADHSNWIVEDGIFGQRDSVSAHQPENRGALNDQFSMSKDTFRAGESVQIPARSIENAVANPDGHRLGCYLALVNHNTAHNAVLDGEQGPGISQQQTWFRLTLRVAFVIKRPARNQRAVTY